MRTAREERLVSGVLIRLSDPDLFGNDAAEDEEQDIFASYAVDVRSLLTSIRLPVVFVSRGPIKERGRVHFTAVQERSEPWLRSA
jgi:hypothetical protein